MVLQNEGVSQQYFICSQRFSIFVSLYLPWCSCELHPAWHTFGEGKWLWIEGWLARKYKGRKIKGVYCCTGIPQMKLYHFSLIFLLLWRVQSRRECKSDFFFQYSGSYSWYQRRWSKSFTEYSHVWHMRSSPKKTNHLWYNSQTGEHIKPIVLWHWQKCTVDVHPDSLHAKLTLYSTVKPCASRVGKMIIKINTYRIH